MAHLKEDTLPSQFDVVVDGTGVTESIVAAALARCGKSVLHLDRNSYYGRKWASLMHKEMLEFLQSPDSHSMPSETFGTTKEEDIIILKSSAHVVSNLLHSVHGSSVASQPGSVISGCDGIPASETVSTVYTQIPDPGSDTTASNDSATSGTVTATPDPESVTPGHDSVTSGPETATSGPNCNTQGHDAGAEAATAGPDSVECHDAPNAAVIREVESGVSWNSLGTRKTRLIYDITPKLLACRGALVELLTQCGCSRYLEFKAVDKICLYQSGKVEQVPCSRADVFESKLVSMMEKRKMMKFLSFCANFDLQSEQNGLEGLTFSDFLKQKGLTENLMQYVLLCISMAEGSVSAKEGVQSAKLFLQSLGRFDNAPFLYPIFGSGEISQAFCRYCAVYGGVYCLKRCAQALHVSELNGATRVSAVTCSSGQTISCSAFVCAASSITSTVNTEPNCRVSRAIILADDSLNNTDGKPTLLTVPSHTAGNNGNVRVLQLPPSTKTAVNGTYLFHLACTTRKDSDPKQDLEGVIHLLFNTQDDGLESSMSGPTVLWSLYFNVDLFQIDHTNVGQYNLPENVYLASDPDTTVTYEHAIEEAKVIFGKICPDSLFLPPHQEDPSNSD